MKFIFLLLPFLMVFEAAAHAPFQAHVKKIRDIEDKIKDMEDEVDLKEKSKMNSRSLGRVEEAVERIIEIHGELIGHRRDMEIELSHIRSEHPEEGKVANLIVGVKARMAQGKVRREVDPLSIKMNDLFRKVQRKYASFLSYQGEEVPSEISRVNDIVKKQRGKRKDKEALGYIKKKGRVRLTK